MTDSTGWRNKAKRNLQSSSSQPMLFTPPSNKRDDKNERELRAQAFLGRLQRTGYWTEVVIPYTSSIGSVEITLSIVKRLYKRFVMMSCWTEEKFFRVIGHLMECRATLSEFAVAQTGPRFDRGELEYGAIGGMDVDDYSYIIGESDTPARR